MIKHFIPNKKMELTTKAEPIFCKFNYFSSICVSSFLALVSWRIMEKYLKIPLDYTGKPDIIDGMKAKFISEFSVMKMVADEEGDEHLCALIIPWTTCKEIYQAMAAFAGDETNKPLHADQNSRCTCGDDKAFYATSAGCPVHGVNRFGR